MLLYLLCLDVCLQPSISNGHIETVVNKTSTPGDSALVMCDAGFKASALNTTCNHSRFWDPQPVCIKRCHDTTDVSHEAVIRFPDLVINEAGNALYNSEHFFLSSGGIEIECQENEKLKWKKQPNFGKYLYLSGYHFNLNAV